MGQLLEVDYTDGTKHLAEVLLTLEIDDIEYVVYSCDLNNGLYDIMASQIVVAEDGCDDLVPIQNEKHKKLIEKGIQSILKLAKLENFLANTDMVTGAQLTEIRRKLKGKRS